MLSVTMDLIKLNGIDVTDLMYQEAFRDFNGTLEIPPLSKFVKLPASTINFRLI